MLILIISLLFCMARNLVPEAWAFFAGMETHAAILALCTSAFIIFRAWSVARGRVASGNVAVDHV